MTFLRRVRGLVTRGDANDDPSTAGPDPVQTQRRPDKGAAESGRLGPCGGDEEMLSADVGETWSVGASVGAVAPPEELKREALRPATPEQEAAIRALVSEKGPGENLEETLREGLWIDHVLESPDLRRVGFTDHETATNGVRTRLRTEQRAAAVWLMLTLERRGAVDSRGVGSETDVVLDALVWLSTQRLLWGPRQANFLWWQANRLISMAPWQDMAPRLLALPIAAAEDLADDDRAPLHLLIRNVLQSVTREHVHSQNRLMDEVVSRLYRLLPPAPAAGLRLDVLGPDDAFGPRIRAELLDRFDEPTLVPFLEHLAAHRGGVTPSKKWRSGVSALLTGEPARAEVARLLLDRVRTHRETTLRLRTEDALRLETVFLADATAQLVRAAVWAAREAGADWVASLLGDVAVQCGSGSDGPSGSPRCSEVASSAVTALGELDAELAVSQLAELQSKLRNRPLLKVVEKALLAAAARAGLTATQLLEQSVPGFGLSTEGRLEQPIGDHVAVVTAEPSGARLSWRTSSGREVRGTPTGLREDDAEKVAALRTTVKQASTVLGNERVRLEDLLVAGQEWSGRRWEEHYLAHPITGVHVRRLLWEVRRAGYGDGWIAGLPHRNADGPGLRTLDDDVVPVCSDDSVRLWHPITAEPSVVGRWRDLLTEREMRQPFKQVFREIYVITPAEEATETYSNRYAGHVLRYPQAAALMRTRRWFGNHLGHWQGGSQGEATHDLGNTGWRAKFFYDRVEGTDNGTAQLCSSDQIRFERLSPDQPRAEWEQARLVDVPPVVFSEAMRDVDFFAAVATIAADPTWVDHGDARYLDYWRRTIFADLTASAQVRREALVRLMPRTKIADRVRVGERFLEVDGKLHTYKIHLGTGNILMSPNDTYLCIVSDRRSASSETVFLPFEEDGGMLSVIVSKAFLLADDHEISDPAIARQIQHS